MEIKNYIHIDFTRGKDIVVPSIQYDSGTRWVMAKLYDNGLPIDLQELKVCIVAVKPDGKEIFNECKIIDAEKGIIEFEITKQMGILVGEVECQIKLFGPDQLLSSNIFKLSVTKTLSPSSESSKDELDVLVNALGQVQDIDNRFAETNAQLSDIDNRFAETNAQLSDIDNRFAETNAQLSDIDNRFAQTNAQLSTILKYPPKENEAGRIVGWEYASTHNIESTETNYVTNVEYPYGDIRRYGGIGDGISDDTLALQRAFYCNETIALEPNKTYIINSGIFIPNNVCVNGNNSTIIFNLDSERQFFYKANYETEGRGLFSDCLIKTNFYNYSDNAIHHEHLIINDLKIKVNFNLSYVPNRDYRLFEIGCYGDIIFKNSEIIVGENYVYNEESDLLQDSYVKNNIQPIVIRNCSNKVLIENTIVKNFTKGHIGSTVWFHAHTERGHKNINIINSNFYCSSGDEIMSFLGNSDLKAKIVNCSFERRNNKVFDYTGQNYRNVDFMFVVGPINQVKTISGNIEVNFSNCNIKTSNNNNEQNVNYCFAVIGGQKTKVNVKVDSCNIDLNLRHGLISSEDHKTASFCENKIDYLLNNNLSINHSYVKFYTNSFNGGISGSNAINHSINNCLIHTNRQLYHLEYPNNNCITSFNSEICNNTIFIQREKDIDKNIFHGFTPEYLNTFKVCNNTINTVDKDNNIIKDYKFLYVTNRNDVGGFNMNHAINSESKFINFNNYLNGNEIEAIMN